MILQNKKKQFYDCPNQLDSDTGLLNSATPRQTSVAGHAARSHAGNTSRQRYSPTANTVDHRHQHTNTKSPRYQNAKAHPSLSMHTTFIFLYSAHIQTTQNPPSQSTPTWHHNPTPSHQPSSSA
ncbi:hypothetical protein R6Q59_009983 [Mikania micrantha]